MTFVPVLVIVLAAFGLNLIWEVSHAWLYATCRRQSWQKNLALLTRMAITDSWLIVFFYLVTAVIFGTPDIASDGLTLAFFVLLCVGFSFVDERVSLRLKRWEYAPAMPIIFGVGLSPLLELAVTGLTTLLIVKKMLL